MKTFRSLRPIRLLFSQDPASQPPNRRKGKLLVIVAGSFIFLALVGGISSLVFTTTGRVSLFARTHHAARSRYTHGIPRVGSAFREQAKRAVTAVTPEPTPVFAYYKDIKLHVPVPMCFLTELALHQASYRYAVDLEPALPVANTEQCDNERGTKRPSQQPTGDAIMKGSILELWRPGQQGLPDTSVDCGGAPGTLVLSPVDGVVTEVKHYKLYKKYDDVAVHIALPGHSGLELVAIHLTDVDVKTGDKVVAGKTPLARIRKLSDKEPMQLRHYTAKGDEGDHVHIQINDTEDPLYIKIHEDTATAGSVG